MTLDNFIPHKDLIGVYYEAALGELGQGSVNHVKFCKECQRSLIASLSYKFPKGEQPSFRFFISRCCKEIQNSIYGYDAGEIK